MIPLTQKVNGVDLPVYMLRKTADKSVIKARTLSNTIAGRPVPGPGEQYLPILIDVLPVFDPNYNVVAIVEAANESVPQWEVKYVVSDKTQAVILAAADQVARAQTNQLGATQDFTAAIVVLLTAILRGTSIKNITPTEQAYVTTLAAQATKLLSNQANLDALKVAIKTGAKPDFKTALATP